MLFRKMLRDLSQNKAQFLSIFLMAFLSIFVYAGIGGEWRGMEDTMDTFYADTNFADIWLYGTEFSEAEEKAVAALDDITGIQRRVSAEAIADLTDDPLLTIYIPESYQISLNLTQVGKAYDDTADGVWLDHLFAGEHDLQPGDFLSFSMAGISVEKEILGLIANPEYIYYYTSGEVVPDHAGYRN